MLSLSTLAGFERALQLPLPRGPENVVRHSESSSPINRPDEAEFAEISRQYPTFGGHYFDPSGNLVLAMTDSASVGELSHRLTAKLTSYQARVPDQWKGIRDKGHVVLRHADFSFSELSAWPDVISAGMLGTNGVTLVDLDEERNRGTIGIERGRGYGRG